MPGIRLRDRVTPSPRPVNDVNLCLMCRWQLTSACEDCRDYRNHEPDRRTIPVDISEVLTVRRLLKLTPNARLALLVAALHYGNLPVPPETE
jgi:hypothetical protein